MSDIYGINWISPRWGFGFPNVHFHRALPYAIDLSPLGLRINEQFSNLCESFAQIELVSLCIRKTPHYKQKSKTKI